jgi:transposase InsO family protein
MEESTMPWKEVGTVDARKLFIEEWLRGKQSITALCGSYGISRKTGYKWRQRFQSGGEAALVDQDRVPKRPHQTVCPQAVSALLALRRERPTWGPRKLLHVTGRKHPDLVLPSHATLSRVLQTKGLSKPRKGRQRPESYISPYSGYYGPNASWSVDYKGYLVLKKYRTKCHPLTISDVTSRYLFSCEALADTCIQGAKRTFKRIFREYGLPDVMRSDNGTPFSSLAPGGLSELSIWWIKLGIRPERITPGRPTQNSRHERIHRTLKEDCPVAATIKQQQVLFDDFMHIYNTERPHQALNNDVPADRYVRSTRYYPARLADPTYAHDFFVERVGKRGALRFGGTSDKITPLLAGELVGLERIDYRLWKVFFGPVPLGTFSPKGFHMATRKRPKTNPHLLPMS